MRIGGPASSPELSVGGKGAWWTGLVASVGGGVVSVCVSISDGDAPLSLELTVGANGDAVDWTLLPPLEYSSGGGTNVGVAFGDALLTASRGNKNTACRDAISL